MTSLNRKLKKLFSILLLCTLFFSCDAPALYDYYQPLDNTTWEKNKEYFFSFDIKDTSIPYDLTLEIRNNNLYPYQNLWIICTEDQPVGPMRKDTLECKLTNEYGKWKGYGISLFQTSIPIKQKLHFSHTGLYTFAFRHIMRDEKLEGIQEIGFRVVPLEK